MWPGTPVHMPQEVLFRLSTEDAWKTGRHFAGPGNFPGSWALPPYGDVLDGAPEDGASADGEAAGPDRGNYHRGLRRLCLAVDIEKYSARDNADMVRLQRVLLRTLRAACAGRRRLATLRPPGPGDGYCCAGSRRRRDTGGPGTAGRDWPRAGLAKVPRPWTPWTA